MSEEYKDQAAQDVEMTVNTKEEKPAKESKPSWDVFDIAEIFVLCTAFIVLFFSVFIRMTVVEGDSMTNTLQDGEYLLIQDFFYTPSRGDIVVVNDVTKESIGKMYSKPLVKRVIGIGGDTVEIKDGVVSINGKAIDEPYIKEEMRPTDSLTVTLEENEVFVMGDNRNHSGDSRLIGPVDVRCIVGKAIVRIYPFDKFTILSHAEG